MCVREASLVPRSYTCRALPDDALTSRRQRRQLFATYPHQTGTGGVRYPENVYPVDRVRARCAIRARLLGARPQEAVCGDGSARFPAPVEQKLHISHLTSSTYMHI